MYRIERVKTLLILAVDRPRWLLDSPDSLAVVTLEGRGEGKKHSDN